MIFLRIIIIFFVFSTTGHSIRRSTFLAGFGLWQHNTNYINTLELGWEQKINNFQYALALPIFFPLDDTPSTYGTPQKTFKNLSERRYLTTILSRAIYDSRDISFGLDDSKNFFSQSFLWGNPFFDPETPFLGSHLFLRTSFLSLYSFLNPGPFSDRFIFPKKILQ